MAVVAVWKCDRDGAMFDNKKDAEEHDKMLELAANITALIERNVEGVSEEACEEIGLMLAKRRDVLAKACKGKPEALLEAEQSDSEQADDENVTPLAANQ
ncbi:YebG family protein [uncultured Microbulbifer sp.]|uniref:YebG family protein n=1 Tax=uncultured Microbulbifer sp. TaxID=348147 RepID=UPI00260B34BB|nr:YebG family protein [uncultured Microbulbifer sp.]